MPRALAPALVALLLAACGAAATDDAPPQPAFTAFTASAPDFSLTELPKTRDDGRLPGLATPLRYSLALEVDPGKPRFSGHARILVHVPARTSNIVLHGQGLHVTRASTRVGATLVVAQAQFRKSAGGDTEDELVLAFEKALPAGTGTLEIDYDAPFGDDLGGLYRVEEGGRSYAFSQFETADARRAFPCFDEPAWKTPYDVQITVPRGMIALGNAPEAARRDDGDHTVFDFATSRPLPSYLVAFAVGDFDVVEAKARGAAGIPIRLVATKGKGHLAELALAAASDLTDRLGAYFDIRYPFAKLDLVAVPEFAAGAMENPGLITFRDEVLLLDPRTSSTASRRAQILTIAHELSHMWLGDLVTMEWWDDLWLNEGMATFMESKMSDAYAPQLGSELEAKGAIDEVMDTDATHSARTVRQPVRTTSEALEAFDGFSYDKGAALLRMTEAYVGPEVFQRGLRGYVKAHAWKTARAKDLLSALDRVSGKDVTKVLTGFLDHPGVPEVTVRTGCDAGKGSIELAARPWKPLGAEPRGAGWTVPVCFGGGGCSEVGEATLTRAADCDGGFFPNVAGAGYFRVALDAKDAARALDAGKKLAPAAREALIADLWSTVREGALEPEALLDLLPRLDREHSPEVVAAEVRLLHGVDDALIDDIDRVAFRAYVAARFAKLRPLLSFAALPKGDDDAVRLRAAVFDALGFLAEDPTVLQEAEPKAEAWLKDPTAVDADVAELALVLASRHAPRNRLDALRDAAKNAKTPEDRALALEAMSALGDKAALTRALDLLLHGEIKLSEYRHFPGPALGYRASREVVYAWMKSHWPGLVARVPHTKRGELAQVVSGLCTPALIDDARTFFGEALKNVEGAKRPLEQALDSAAMCSALRSWGAPKVAAYFRKQAP